jgi:hypothetical protein
MNTEPKKDKAPRGDCSVCGRSIQLKKDGTVRHHGGERSGSWPHDRHYRCDGSDLPPKGGAS